MFQSQRDAEITIGIYRRVSVLWRDESVQNPWNLSFMSMFHMANDSGLFYTLDQLERHSWTPTGNVFMRSGQRMLPLYEAKLVHHFDHRLACYSKRPEGSQDTELPRLDADEKNDPSRVPIPRYWIAETEVNKRLAGRWEHEWFLGWRDIARSTDERTLISTIIPRSAVSGKFPLILAPVKAWLLGANLTSFVLDFSARQKIAGTSLAFFVIKQLPIIRPDAYSGVCAWANFSTIEAWMKSRILELNYTAYDMESFARDLGYDEAPFRWDEERRFRIRAELDAAYFHLYQVERSDVEFIMDTFPIVKRKDEQLYGAFRTKELILGVYDAMTEATRTGVPYQTILDPPPGRGPRHRARRNT